MKQKYLDAFMDIAERFGETSTASRLKVGALIYKNDSIISLGCNGQPPGWHTEVCEGEDGTTLPTVRHAEEAALQKLWNSTETANGAYMLVNYSPCLGCAIKICTAGITRVYYRHAYRSLDGVNYLKENGIYVEQLKGDLNATCEAYSEQE